MTPPACHEGHGALLRASLAQPDRVCASDARHRSATRAFPTFDKTCTSAGDCVIGIHQSDCCGSRQAIGMNETEQARFSADEATCVAQYSPGCECPPAFPLAEGGQSAFDGKTIVVECQSNQCITTVK